MWESGYFIAIIAIVCVIGLPIVAGWILGLQWIKSRNNERMGLINQGIIPSNSGFAKKSDPNQLVSLRNGIVLIALGIGIIIGFLCSEYLTIGQGNAFWMIGASVVFFLGIGFLAYFLIVKRMPEQQLKDEIGEE